MQSIQATLIALLLSVGSAARAGVFVRGEVALDGRIDLSDAISTLDYLFLGGEIPPCLKAADMDDDGVVNLTDPIFLLGHLFLGGPPLPAPYPAAGEDPTPDGLDCAGPAITDLIVEPAVLALPRAGATAQLRVTAKLGGVETDVTGAASGVTYESSDDRVAGVYRDGIIEAAAQGSATVTVRFGGLDAGARVVVERDGSSPLHRVLAANDLGMHCMDREFAVFSILPPFNVLRSQVIVKDAAGKARLLGPSEIDVRYSAIADPVGSRNSASASKTGFWSSAERLFGVPLDPGQGLLGLYMPDDAPSPGPQSFSWSETSAVFEAPGIPITPTDDAGSLNSYPLLRVTAFDKAAAVPLAHVDVVVPVSQEIDCAGCHATGQVAAKAGYVRWSKDPDIEIQTKRNILAIHDYRSHTTLQREQPVLCAKCHYSAALDLAGAGPSAEQAKHQSLTRSMHGFHGVQTDAEGKPLFPPGGSPEETCYRCHPGKVTRCQRGAMRTGGMTCSDCHGGMPAVAGSRPLEPGGSLDGTNDGKPRRGWTDLPRCQSCHTGDEVSSLQGPEFEVAADGLRLRQAFRKGDESGSAILAANKRFAENDSRLFRFSKGHGGILCEGCHGSAHAEWPNADAAHNDNLAAAQLQGHAGVISECKTCHETSLLPLGLAGPHGLHPIGDMRWIKGGHGHFYEKRSRECKACHGADLLGSPLARSAVDRVLHIEDDEIVRLVKGEEIRCNRCHRMPPPPDQL